MTVMSPQLKTKTKKKLYPIELKSCYCFLTRPYSQKPLTKCKRSIPFHHLLGQSSPTSNQQFYMVKLPNVGLIRPYQRTSVDFLNFKDSYSDLGVKADSNPFSSRYSQIKHQRICMKLIELEMEAIQGLMDQNRQ